MFHERTGQDAGARPAPQPDHGQQTDPESLAVTHGGLVSRNMTKRRESREDRGASSGQPPRKIFNRCLRKIAHQEYGESIAGMQGCLSWGEGMDGPGELASDITE